MTIRTDLNGLRVKLPGNPAIYLMDEGRRRHIPNPSTYDNLFRDWNGIVEDTDIPDIDEETPISNGAILARAVGTAAVFLIDKGLKRHITSPAIMDRYHFNWGKIHDVAPALIDSIPSGPSI